MLFSLQMLRMFDWIAEERKLDILINNGGAMWIPERKTVDGFASIFATNHLGECEAVCFRLYVNILFVC